MSQIIGKFIEDGAITGSKLAGSAVGDTNIQDGAVTNSKVATGIDAVKLADGSVSNTEFQYLSGVTSDVQTQLNDKIESSLINANNGVCGLDAGGKVAAAQLPSSIMEFQGQWNATTNSPALIDGTGDAGDVYRVDTAGTQDLGSGSITYAVGDWVMYSGTVWQKANNSNLVSSVNGQQGVVSLDTDDIAEGTALYFTNERAQDAVGSILSDSATIDFTYNDAGNTISAQVIATAVNHNDLQNYVANEHVDHSSVSVITNSNSGLSGGGDLTASRTLLVDPNNATSVTAAGGDFVLIADVSDANAVKKVTVSSIAALASGGTHDKETFTLNGTNITNQYLDLAQVARTGSIHFIVKGGAPTLEGASHDYSVSYTGGAGGNTRVTFLNDLATAGASALIAGDIVQIAYVY